MLQCLAYACACLRRYKISGKHVECTLKKTKNMMHDNTSMTLCELSEATQNKSTRGDYHKECCAKGGNITQPCGFNCDKDLTFRFLIFTF